ncbi:GDP-mannose 4,6-dehydratase [Nitratireductor aquimarinus]|uniref:GDP-mannose 4,6-dehydratase n=1 Tax=Nitratireductor aquimarinus TaxID=889300 RepID=A0ABU4ANI8_9HYPH|nr:NAD-dependent epimerase/dehydratase family protein [Nitratireductor aquimarinus]MDV6227808.1 GDP-mannose 4,6-dehydratase [Nitratireductor aquimarinus]
MRILLTGAAGFIGYHVAERLLERGDMVVGVDNLNPYYSVELKEARLARLTDRRGFEFHHSDACDSSALQQLDNQNRFDAILHLAAQAGVRYSVQNPFAYVDANVTGQVSVFEMAAKRPGLPVIYASSSSVYGANEKVPFSESDRVDSPISVYAATKKAGEMLASAYAHTWGVPSTGLRFFTVYGPYGRPDMAPWLFTEALLHNREISVFNGGDMERDFTHISDIVEGVVAATELMATSPDKAAPVYNLGNNRPVRLMHFIHSIEDATQRKAQINFKPKPKGDVVRTYADISLAQRDLGFSPKTTLDEGIPAFVTWFKSYHGL